MTTQEILNAFEITFVHQTDLKNVGSRWNDKENPIGIKWRYNLTLNGQSLQGDYWQGIGHLPKQVTSKLTKNWTRSITIHDDSIITNFLKNGSTPVGDYGHIKYTGKPNAKDILYSLLLDGRAINYSDFEEWANEYGYDSDSRKAEKIYRTCLETGLKLRSMLGDKKLVELEEEFQDY